MGLLGRMFQRKKENTMTCTAIVPAAGHATRMGGEKILFPLGENEVPVILHTLWVLESSSGITEIIVVTREDLIVPISKICKDAGLRKVKKVVVGGENRMASVLSGLREADPASELVAIHDAARPLVTKEIVDQTIQKAAVCGAAAPAIPVKDTIKRAVNGVVVSTPDRSELFAVQTPQVFEHGLILGALEKAMSDEVEVTDDCAAVERLGMTVSLTEGSYENIKLTTPEDILVAETILERRGAL